MYSMSWGWLGAHSSFLPWALGTFIPKPVLLSNKAAKIYVRLKTCRLWWRGERGLSQFATILKLFTKYTAPKSPHKHNLKPISLPWPSLPWFTPSQTTASAAATASSPKVSHTAAQLSFPWQPPLRTTQNKYSDRPKEAKTTVRSKLPALSKLIQHIKAKTTLFDVAFRLESEAFREMGIARFLSHEQSWC